MKEELKNNLGGSVPHQITDSPQELVLTIPEELKGNELNIVYAASWISNLKVNDSSNTVTGTVSANTGASRSTTITLTASGKLSTTSPYSFTLYQEGKRVCSLTVNLIPTSWYDCVVSSTIVMDASVTVRVTINTFDSDDQPILVTISKGQTSGKYPLSTGWKPTGVKITGISQYKGNYILDY